MPNGNIYKGAGRAVYVGILESYLNFFVEDKAASFYASLSSRQLVSSFLLRRGKDGSFKVNAIYASFGGVSSPSFVSSILFFAVCH